MKYGERAMPKSAEGKLGTAIKEDALRIVFFVPSVLRGIVLMPAREWRIVFWPDA